ncbi:MAG TPA: formate dehydrogenase accessory sulfurtransferase FdhD [Methanobacterium sp.]|nr:MAG: formate dehydrogenase accessory sulfurtransferase FdhD [Methanobacterium sp.]HOI72111.1 formate dehydrogenase accessory sulfurtransferase FdhD [Methanobacterium sp.]HPX77333.1 formate dehydrogenase accessory sulfurtransferase FdhD [Methanobacterium sp.]
MHKMTREVKAFKVQEDSTPVREIIVCDEDIELTINKQVSRNFSISPNNLKEFAVGYLLGEGLAGTVDDITRVDLQGNKINVEISVADFDLRKELIVGSDCFGGWRRKIEMVDKVESDFQISKESLFDAFAKLKDSAKIWQETGGTHVAGMVYKDNFISVEDVSRHVAVDKLVGTAALKKFDFSRSFVVYSGRMPADMMIKIARIKIPILASNAAPTSSGVTVAQESGVTMIGFVRGDRFNIYSSPERILI